MFQKKEFISILFLFLCLFIVMLVISHDEDNKFALQKGKPVIGTYEFFTGEESLVLDVIDISNNFHGGHSITYLCRNDDISTIVCKDDKFIVNYKGQIEPSVFLNGHMKLIEKNKKET